MASNFGKRLKREVLGNPKKASLLGLLCLVAVYFWAPLVTGWFKGDDVNSVAAAPVTGSAPTATGAATTTTAAPPVAAIYTWKQIAECLDRVGHMHNTNAALAQRDPFKPVVETLISKPEKTEVRPTAPAISPRAAGLALSSTMVGPRFSVALIGGEAYRVGDEIPSETDASITFRLKAVYAKHVVVERNGQEFELALKNAEALTDQVTSHHPAITQDIGPEDE